MNAITTLIRPESASSREQFQDVEHVSQFSTAGARPALETELSDIMGRLVTGAVAEANAAVARARAASQIALEAARVALEEQTRRNDGLSASLSQSESQVEELRLKLQIERDNTKAATDAYETSQKARAEAANEAEAIREQVVAAYESRLHAVQAELDAVRAALIGLKQQYEIETADRARVIAVLKTVQQTCALVECQETRHEGWMPAEDRHEIISHTDDQLSAAPHDDCAPENHEIESAVQMRNDETPSPALSAAGRSLKLVAPSEVAPIAAPPHLVDYLQGLFEQINAMYLVDLHAHAMVDVLDRLCVNVRHARDVFVQRASVEGAIGADLFDQALSAKLNELGATSLGRHLSIAAYELTHAKVVDVRAEASADTIPISTD